MGNLLLDKVGEVISAEEGLGEVGGVVVVIWVVTTHCPQMAKEKEIQSLVSATSHLPSVPSRFLWISRVRGSASTQMSFISASQPHLVFPTRDYPFSLVTRKISCALQLHVLKFPRPTHVTLTPASLSPFTILAFPNSKTYS